MKMKEIKLPKELKGLPTPWAMTHSRQRRKQIKRLSYDRNEIKTALHVLDRCLQVLSAPCKHGELTLSSSDSIPESLKQYWDFSADWLARKISRFDEFESIKVEEFLTEYGYESPSANLIDEVASYWIWWVTRDMTKAVLRWMRNAPEKNEREVACLLEIASRYWLQIEPSLAQSLLSRSAMIGWQNALPLLERVEYHPAASAAVRETARDYRQLILDSSAESEVVQGYEGFSVNGNNQDLQRTPKLVPAVAI